MLTAEEARVLGSLVEKHLTTPQGYPLTENALIAACNQTTNREPVVTFSQGVVRRALIRLREQGLARTVHRPGDRVVKHAHRLDEALGLDRPGLAVLALLLLRGSQTPGELRTRAARLHSFDSPRQVEAVLERLADRDGAALVARLERRPGQKEARYGHLLQDQQPEPEAAGSAPADSGPALAHARAAPADAEPVPADGAPAPAAAVPPGEGDLAALVDGLAGEVARLREEVAELRGRLDGSAPRAPAGPSGKDPQGEDPR